jgi:shikimate kinase
MRIFLIGFMGSGKTTVGKELALCLGYSFIDMDKCVEEDTGMSVNQIFSELGEQEFRKLEHDMIIRIIKTDNVVVATGGGVPCYYKNMELINQNGISLYLRMTPEALTDRLKHSRSQRPLIRDLPTDDELAGFIKKKLKEREPFYLKSKHVVDGLDPDIDELAGLIRSEEL